MKPRRSRLVVRIYLFSLATVLVTVLVVVIAATRASAPFDRERMRFAEHIVEDLGRDLADPVALAAQVQRLERETGVTATIYDTGGQLLVSSHDPPRPPVAPATVARLADGPVRGAHGPRPPPPGHDRPPGEHRGPPPGHDGPPRGDRLGPRPPRGQILQPVFLDGKMIAYAIVTLPRPPAPRGLYATVGLVLIVLLAVSALFARRLARPLERLKSAADAFGAGQMDARARLTRGDEIGAVGRAFDAMADRVTGLMASQRELMANVSHELRTPLARIRVALDLAGEGDAETAREVVADIDQDLGEIERLLEDVMTSARLDLAGSAGTPLRLEDDDLAELLERAVARFQTLHDSHPVSFVADDTPLPIHADPALLRRAVDNLLDNARKYSEPGTRIELRAARRGDHAVVEVVDYGIGIDEADLERVFSPFFRTDRSRARATGGVGLGLALAKKIIDAHGGRIAVESHVGFGTTFRIELPLGGEPAVAVGVAVAVAVD